MSRAAKYLPLATLGLWGLFVLLGIQLISAAPRVWMAEQVSIVVPPGGSVDLGRESLGMPAYNRSVASPHLRVSRDPQGAWEIVNLADERKVDVRTDRVESRLLRRWALQVGDSVRLDRREVRVIAADNEQGLVLEADNGERATWRYGRLLSTRRPAFVGCRGQDWLRDAGMRLRWLFRHWRMQEELVLFSLGGQVQCLDRWGLDGLPPLAVRVYWRDGRFWLGNLGDGVRDALQRQGEVSPQRLGSQSLPLDGPEGRVERLVVGRTWFRVSFDAQRLTLEPLRNLPVSFVEEPGRSLPDGVRLDFRSAAWIGAGPWGLPGVQGVAMGVMLLAASVFFAIFLQSIRRAQGETAALGQLWVLTLPLWLLAWIATGGWGAIAADLARAMGLCAFAWLLVTFQLWRQGRLAGEAGVVWLLGVGLAGIGALNLAQLAAGAANTKWLAYASGHLRVLILIPLVVGMAAWLPDMGLRKLATRFLNNRGPMGAVKGFGLLTVCTLLAMQLLVGDEQGLGWIQPVEFAKFVLIFLLASSLTHLHWLRRRDTRDYRSRRGQHIAAAVTLAGVFAFSSLVIMFGVHDNSPALILLALAFPILWILAPNPLIHHPLTTWLRRFVLVGMPLALVVAAAAWIWYHPPDYLSDLPQADRFRVWSDTWGNRQSGDQLIQALMRGREGGWSGVSAWFGANSVVMELPAVQDDFIATFLLNRFGGMVGLVLIAVQTLWLGVLWTLAGRLMRGTPDVLEDRGLFWLGGLLFGLTWMNFAHWGIAWGNVLGLLPVMGQPMTWLSSGNSHMLALALPALGFGMVAGWLARDMGVPPGGWNRPKKSAG